MFFTKNKEHIDNKRAGVLITPALLIVYIVFRGLDLVTTYLVTPDLTKESNWFIRTFNLSWELIIIKDIIIVVIILISVFFASRYSMYVYKSFSPQKKGYLKLLFSNKKLLCSIVVFIWFYTSLIAAIIATVNNTFNYIYLFKKDIILFSLSLVYVRVETYFSPFFHIYLQIIAAIIACYLVFKKSINLFTLN